MFRFLIFLTSLSFIACDVYIIALDDSVRLLVWRDNWPENGIESTIFGMPEEQYIEGPFVFDTLRNRDFSRLFKADFSGYSVDFTDCLECTYLLIGAHRPVAQMDTGIEGLSLAFNADLLLDVANKAVNYKKMTIFEGGEGYKYSVKQPDTPCTGELYGVCDYPDFQIYTGQSCQYYYYPIYCFEDPWVPDEERPIMHVITPKDRFDVEGKPDNVIYHEIHYPVVKKDRLMFNALFDKLPLVSTVSRLYEFEDMLINPEKVKQITWFGDSRTSHASHLFWDYDCSQVFDRYPQHPFPQVQDDNVIAASGRSLDLVLLGSLPVPPEYAGRHILKPYIVLYLGVNILVKVDAIKNLDSTYKTFLDVITTSRYIEALSPLQQQDNKLSFSCQPSDSILVAVVDGSGECSIACDGINLFKGSIRAETVTVFVDLPPGKCTSSCRMSETYLCHTGVQVTDVLLIQSSASCDNFNWVQWQPIQEEWCNANPHCFYVPTLVHVITGGDCIHGVHDIIKITCTAVENFMVYIAGGLPIIRKADEKLMYGDTSPLVVGQSDFLSTRNYYTDKRSFDSCPCPFRVTQSSGKSFFKTAVDLPGKISATESVCERVRDLTEECALVTVTSDPDNNGMYEFLLHTKKPFKSAYESVTALLQKTERASSIKDLVDSSRIRGPAGTCVAMYSKPCKVAFSYKGYAVLLFNYIEGDKFYSCHEEIDFMTDISLYRTCELPPSIMQPNERKRLSAIFNGGLVGDAGDNSACVVGTCTAGFFADGPNKPMGGYYCCRNKPEKKLCDITIQSEGVEIIVTLKTEEAAYVVKSPIGTEEGVARAAHAIVQTIPSAGTYNVFASCGSSNASDMILISTRDYCDFVYENKFRNIECKHPTTLYMLIGFIVSFIIVLTFRLLIAYIFGNIICSPVTSCIIAVFGITCRDCGATVKKNGTVHHTQLCPSNNIKGNVIRESTFRTASKRAKWAGNIIGNVLLGFSLVAIVILSVHIVSLEAAKFEQPNNLDNIERLWKGLSVDGFTPSAGIFVYNPDSTYNTIHYEFSEKRCTGGVCTAFPKFRFPGPFTMGEQWYFKAGELDIVMRVASLTGIATWKKLYKTCRTTLLEKSTTYCGDDLTTCQGCLDEVMSDEMSLLSPYTYFLSDTAPGFWDLNSCATLRCKFIPDHCTCFACANKPTEECGTVYKLVGYRASMEVCASVNGKVLCTQIDENKDTDTIISKIYATSKYTKFADINGVIKAGAINDWGVYTNQFGSIQIIDGKVFGLNTPSYTSYCTSGYALQFPVSKCKLDTWGLHKNLDLLNIKEKAANGFTEVIDKILGEFSVTFPMMVVSGGRSTVKINRLEDLNCRGCFGCKQGIYCELNIDAAGNGIATLGVNTGCSVVPPKIDLQVGTQGMSFSAHCEHEADLCLNISNSIQCTTVIAADPKGPAVVNNRGSNSLEDMTLDLGFSIDSILAWFSIRWWYVIGVVAAIAGVLVLLMLLCNFRNYQSGYVRFRTRVKKRE